MATRALKKAVKIIFAIFQHFIAVLELNCLLYLGCRGSKFVWLINDKLPSCCPFAPANTSVFRGAGTDAPEDLDTNRGRRQPLLSQLGH